MEDQTTTDTTVVEEDSFAQDLAKRVALGAATTVGGLLAGIAVEKTKTYLAARKERKAESTTETTTE